MFFQIYLQKLDRDVNGGPADAALLDLALGGEDLSDRPGNDAAVGSVPDHGVRLPAVGLRARQRQSATKMRSMLEKAHTARGPNGPAERDAPVRKLVVEQKWELR